MPPQGAIGSAVRAARLVESEYGAGSIGARQAPGATTGREQRMITAFIARRSPRAGSETGGQRARLSVLMDEGL